jgi:hypothetical protein
LGSFGVDISESTLRTRCDCTPYGTDALMAVDAVRALDVCFINTPPVLMALRHSRESGNPGDECPGDWMPAYAGMTFYWRRTCEMNIE